jgi:hypothetical protein
MPVSVEIVPFKPEHLAAIRLQGVQASAQPQCTEEFGRQLASQTGLARTALLDGQPLAIAGLTELWPGRAFAWAYLAEGWERHAKTVHRAVLAALRASRWRRVEAAIDVRYSAARRWISALGFDFEGVARAFTPDGRDCEIWARVT